MTSSRSEIAGSMPLHESGVPAGPADPSAVDEDPTSRMSEWDTLRHDLKNTIFSITVQCACGRLSLDDGRIEEARQCLARISALAKRLSDDLSRSTARPAE